FLAPSFLPRPLDGGGLGWGWGHRAGRWKHRARHHPPPCPAPARGAETLASGRRRETRESGADSSLESLLDLLAGIGAVELVALQPALVAVGIDAAPGSVAAQDLSDDAGHHLGGGRGGVGGVLQQLALAPRNECVTAAIQHALMDPADGALPV